MRERYIDHVHRVVIRRICNWENSVGHSSFTRLNLAGTCMYNKCSSIFKHSWNQIQQGVPLIFYILSYYPHFHSLSLPVSSINILLFANTQLCWFLLLLYSMEVRYNWVHTSAIIDQQQKNKLNKFVLPEWDNLTMYLCPDHPAQSQLSWCMKMWVYNHSIYITTNESINRVLASGECHARLITSKFSRSPHPGEYYHSHKFLP